MIDDVDLDEYLCELRKEMCKRCIVRPPNAPPCGDIGLGCGVERHLPKLIEICRTVDSPLIDAYADRLVEDVCEHCNMRQTAVCPCPLAYLLPLAVNAVETVEERRHELAAKLTWPYTEMPETD